jgi:hypothetical protein
MALKMERKWDTKNVDLNLLTVRIGDFFKERDFEVIGEKTPRNYQVLAKNSPSFRLLGFVDVTIEGKPEDFVIKLELVENRKRYGKYSSFLLRMIVGGYFLLQGVESDEAWMRLEKEFWQYAENVVLHLTNTAKSSNNDLETDA